MFSNPHESLELFVKTITPKLTYICCTTPLSLTPFQDFIKQTTTTNINYLLNPLQVPHLHPNKELHLSQVEAAGLPKSKGGGGLSYSQNTHQAAFLGSWISVYQREKTRSKKGRKGNKKKGNKKKRNKKKRKSEKVKK